MKILVCSPDSGDFTSFCRAAGPMNRLMRDKHGKIQVIYSHGPMVPEWDEITQADVVLVQRPHTKAHLEICRLVRLCNRKLWLDFDDHFFAVPPSNPGWAHFSQKESKVIVSKAIGLADLVTVSTDKLKEVYAPHASHPERVQVIPNGYDSTLFGYHKGDFQERQKLIWMRGSKTHDEDVHDGAQDIASVLTSSPDWGFLCYGFTPWEIVRDLNPKQWGVRIVPMMQYFYDSYQQRPSVMVVPLTDNEFNQAKSNAAAIEGAMIGSIVVAPADLPEFAKLPGVMLYHPCGAELGKVIREAMTLAGTTGGWEMVKSLRSYILSHLELGILNEKRLSLFETLLRA